MKKLFLLLILSIYVVSCNDDDVCDKETTPYITVEFQNSKGDSISVYDVFVTRKRITDTIVQDTLLKGGISNVKTHSIKIPLFVDTDKTVFYFNDTIRRGNDKIGIPKDTIVVSYRLEEEFVSKACGFKYVFKDIKYELKSPINPVDTINIVEIKANTDEIINESAANLYIRYNKK